MTYSVNLSASRALGLVGGVITLAGVFAMPWINALFIQMTAFDVAQQLSRSNSFQADVGNARIDVLLIHATPLIGIFVILAAFARSEQWLVIGGAAAGVAAVLLIVQANESSAFRLAQPGSGYGAATLGLVLAAVAALVAFRARAEGAVGARQK